MKTRYDIILHLFEKEEKRREDLMNRIKLYISLFTFYLGAVAFSLKDIGEALGENPHWWQVGFWIITLIILLIPFWIVISALRKKHNYLNQLATIVENEEEATEDQFLQSRISDMVTVHEHNVNVNDEISEMLGKSLKALYGGMIFSFILLVILVVN